jgi:hypothetical protein
MERILNILFYNFHKVDYNYRKFLLVYLNPFCWIINFKKIKLGSKLFFEHMEKNFPTFLNLYRNDNYSKIFFVITLIFINCFFINIILLLFNVNLVANYLMILLIATILASVLSLMYLFQDDKFYEYHKMFEKDEKYSYPFLSIVILLLILPIWICTFYI